MRGLKRFKLQEFEPIALHGAGGLGCQRDITGSRGPEKQHRGGLLYFCFLEYDVLADDRVVFALLHFFGQIARVLFGHVIEPGIGGAHQLDQDGIGFRHRPFPRPCGF